MLLICHLVDTRRSTFFALQRNLQFFAVILQSCTNAYTKSDIIYNWASKRTSTAEPRSKNQLDRVVYLQVFIHKRRTSSLEESHVAFDMLHVINTVITT